MGKDLVIDMYHGDVVTSWEQIWDDGIRGIIHKASQFTCKFAQKIEWIMKVFNEKQRVTARIVDN